MKEVVNFLVENAAVIIGLIAVVVVAVIAIVRFVELPTAQQQAKVKQCLLAWVIQAEKELGSGTGKVKLSTVYGWFVTAFPVLKNFISLSTFSDWVDEALETMETMLESNKNLKTIVEGENN